MPCKTGLLALVVLLLTTALASAEDPAAQAALLRRLEKLEKQNEELQKSVQEQREQLRVQQELLRQRDKPAEPTDPDAVKKIVEGYLRDKPAATEVSAVTPASAQANDLKLTTSWKDGFVAETANKSITFHAGGRVDFDAGFYRVNRDFNRSLGAFNNYLDANSTGTGPGLLDGADLRRVRLRFDGTLYDAVEYVVESDFSNYIDERGRTLGVPTSAGTAPPTATPAGTPFNYEPASGVRFTDVYLGLHEIPYLGVVRAGHQKEQLEFANAESSRYLTFMERPLIFDAFNDDYQYALGITVMNNLFDHRASYWIGFFRNTNPFTNDNRNGGFDTGDGRYTYDARLTALPVWVDDGQSWVHLGADYSYRSLHDDVTRFRALPLVRTGGGFEIPNIINTGAIYSKNGQQNFTLEYASAFGPFTLTAEYAGSVVRDAYTGGLPSASGKLPTGVASRGDYLAQGYYVEALYFLTGDHREYDREDRHAYTRVRPRANFWEGCGAWEIGVRYDYLDLSNHSINGGVVHAVTAGLNWYLNPNAKIQANYIWMERTFEPTNTVDRVAGDINGFGMRFHFDF